MITTIKMQGRVGRFNSSPFLLTANENLTVMFDIPERRAGKYVVTFKHGDDELTFYLVGRERSATLQAEWLNRAGTAPLEVFLELRDTAGCRPIIPSAKSHEDKDGFFIEPLKIVEMEKGWSCCGWLQELERVLAEIGVKVEDVSKRVKSFEEDGIPLTFEE